MSKKLTEQQIIEFFAKNDISLIDDDIDLDKINLTINTPLRSFTGSFMRKLRNFFGTWNFELYFGDDTSDDFDDDLLMYSFVTITIPRKFVDLEVK